MKNIKRITTLYLILILLIIAFANQGDYIYILASLVKNIPYGDKLGHFILMGILAFFVNILFNGEKIKIFGELFLKGSVIVLIIVTLEEFSQIFIANRSFDLIDLTFDYLGILVFGQLAKYLIQRKHQKMKNEK